ncbi:MAG: cytochrome c biogenesis protein CcsA, partial [Coriobacteriia bacterium]
MDIGTIGNVLLGLASLSAIASIGAYAFGGQGTDNTRKLGHLLTFGVFGFTTLAIVLLATAFLTENWALQYVIFNHPTTTGPWAWLYRLSGVWAGREGSLLFWEWILAIYAAFIAGKFMKSDSRLGAVGLAVLNFVQLFFLAALFIDTNNPFVAAPPGMVDPATGALLTSAAMNPLLQTWAMVLHPPTLFVGYAGLAVPFAFGLAALITGDVSKKWVVLTDRITVFSWLLLGIGIGLGSVWAYYELAFGGYWAWDPVENASLLPWLTGVGLVHSMTVYRRREGFRMWTFMMAAVTFVFVLLGTFITRSGIVQSVHAFQEDPLSFWLFLIMMVGSLAVMAFGVIKRRDQLSSEADGFEKILSKEGSYYFNNVLMLISAVLVAYMTMASAFPQWMPLGGQSIKAPSYDALARPLGI